MDLAIEATGLRKHFGDVKAVDGVDLLVRPGGVYGFLGPNGAGKTTTIRMLATLLKPDGGTARVLGHDIVTQGKEVRRRVSLTGQFASVDEDLTGAENLILLARLLGKTRPQAKTRAAELLHAFGLAEAADRQVKTFSGGMRRRLDVAASLVVTPDLIFLDEPTTGLDPRSRNQVWAIVRALVAEGTSRELKAQVGGGTLRVRLHDPSERVEAEGLLVGALSSPVQLEGDPTAVSATVADSEQAAYALAELARSGIAVTDFSLGQPSLDEVFLALTGHPAEQSTDEQDEDAA